MSIYSPLFKFRTRKTPPAAHDPLDIARIRSALENLAVLFADSPPDANARKLLEEELIRIIRPSIAALYSRRGIWQNLMDAVREENIPVLDNQDDPDDDLEEDLEDDPEDDLEDDPEDDPEDTLEDKDLRENKYSQLLMDFGSQEDI